MRCYQLVVASERWFMRCNNKKSVNFSLVFVALSLVWATATGFSLPKDPGTDNQQAMQQGIAVTGTVSDESGTLPGVSVSIKGTPLGVITDINGRFSITAPSVESILVFSFVGYTTQEVKIGNLRIINVSMAEAVKAIDEVVVVGYGVQKKESTVAAIGQVKGDEMLKMSPVSLSNALSGTVAGVAVVQTTGRPGADQGKIFIRGVSSWQGSDPLVLVDGIERNFNDIDPNEVETLSVLKDASATAVFGVRGANGVILVTTKRGEKGKVKVTANAELIAKQAINVPNVKNSYITALLWNEAKKNDNDWAVGGTSAGGGIYSDEALEHYRLQDMPYVYPSTDWQALMMKKMGWSQKYNVNISGGTDFARVFASVSYLHDGDILKTEKQPDYDPTYRYDRFNYRFNIDLDVTKSTILSLDAGGYTGIENRPFETGVNAVWRSIMHLGPMAGVPFYPAEVLEQYPDPAHPDETGYRLGDPLLHVNAQSPYQCTNFSGQRSIKETDMTMGVKLQQKLDFITPGLSVQGRVAYSWDMKFRRNWQLDAITWRLNENGTWSRNSGRGSISTNSETPASPVTYNDSGREGDLHRKWYYEASVNYDRTFGKHTVTGLFLGYRQKKQTTVQFPRFEEGLVGRLTYDYDARYLLEYNLAYNGSEQFAPDKRYGFFPSYGLGWNIHNERFFASLKPIIGRAKIRVSHGEVGYDASDAGAANRWLYTSSWSTQTYAANIGAADKYWPGFTDGNAYTAYIAEENAANAGATWEKAVKQDLGFELGFLKGNMFVLSVDLFRENRTQILLERQQIPNMFGVGMKRMNFGETKTKGYEIELKYQQTMGKLYWWLKPSISFSDNRIINRDEPEAKPGYQKQEGHRIHQIFGYTLQPDRLIQNPDEQMNSVRSGTYVMTLGDSRWIDFNADGLIDVNDQIPIGYSRTYPLYNYGLGGGVKYGNWELDFLFQAVSHYSKKTRDGMCWYLHRLTPHVFPHQLDYWTPDNRDAFYPTPHCDTPGYHNRMGSDVDSSYSIWDASYIRLKAVNLTYNLPKHLLNKVNIDKFSVFLRGNNLLTWKKLPYDPEISQEEANNQIGDFVAGNYPILRRFTLGVQLTF